MSTITAQPTTARRIHVEDVRAALQAVADRYPGRRDARTDDAPQPYLSGGKPSCLVAHILARLGFSLAVIGALDAEYPTGELVRPGVRIAESHHAALRRLDPLARQLLAWIQTGQERGERYSTIAAQAFQPGSWFGARFLKGRKPWLR